MEKKNQEYLLKQMEFKLDSKKKDMKMSMSNEEYKIHRDLLKAIKQ